MPADLAEVKSQLRQHCRELRASLGEETRTHVSQSICEVLERWPIFRQSDRILSYMPIKAEVDLIPLLDRHPEKQWILPRIIPEEEHQMVFHPYDARRLVRHPFGMAEPAADSPIVPREALQLVLVPGLAFDRQGWRLGYGGGYFDRFLKLFTGISVGIVFHALFLENLPHGEFDVSMQWIATENGILQVH